MAAAAGIWGSFEPDLCARYRIDPGCYRFRLPRGSYLVSLGFCELEEHLPGRRVFEVALQGRAARESVDPFALAGFAQAFRLRFSAMVEEDGSLVVELRRREGSKRPPALSALWIHELPPDREPEPPASFRGAGSYGLNALFWDPGPDEAEIAGFVIERRGHGETEERPSRPLGEEAFRALAADPVPAGRWLDENLRAGKTYEYRIAGVSASGRRGRWSPVVALKPRLPADSALPVYSLDVPKQDLERLLEDVGKDVRVSAVLSILDRKFSVRLRLQGASTRQAAKLGYRIQLKEDDSLEGRRAFYLKAEPWDFTLQQEKLSCDFFAALGLPASRARHVNLFLNGRYQGVYLDLDPVDPSLLERAGFSPGLLVRSASFQHAGGKIGRKRGAAGRKGELGELLRAVQRLERGEFGAFVRLNFDWPRLRDYLAAMALCHRSEIESDDFYYFRDGATRRWLLVPWDHNNGNFAVVPGRRAAGRPFLPLFGQTLQGIGADRPWWYALPSRVFQDEELRREYLDRLEALDREWLLGGKAAELIEANHRRLRDEVPLDPRRWPPGRDEPFMRSAGELKRFAREHGERLLDLIAAERRRPPEPVVVSKFQSGSEGSWIEVWNRGSSAVSLLGYRIVDLEREEGRLSRFPEGSLEPGGFRVVRLEGSRLDPHGGAFALLAPGAGGRVADFFFYGRRSPGFSYGRAAGDFGFLRPSPEAPNGGLVEPGPPWIEDQNIDAREDRPVAVRARVSVPYETKNILWMAELPNRSTSTPILAGDRIFAMAEPDELVCIDKRCGRILWTAAANLFEALAPEERWANPAYADRVDPLVANLKRETDRLRRTALRAKIQETLREIDARRFTIPADGHFE